MSEELSIEQRIAALEQIHQDFQIVGGHNVTVEGSLQTGYAICSTCPSAAPTGGVIPPSPPPGLVCPDDISGAFHNVTFEGITVSCGCVIYELHPLESVITTGDPNGIGTVIASGSPPWLTGTLAVMHSEYYGDTTCSDNFGSSDTITEGFVWCADEGGAWVYLRCGAEGAEALFLARVTDFGVPTANTLTCGQFVDPLVGFGFGPANAVGTGGTVTIAI